MIGESAILTTSVPVTQGHATSIAAFATVTVYREAEPVLAAWAELETSAPCSIYQTRSFLQPWVARLAAKARLRPAFILAAAADGTPTGLLCLGLSQRGPFRTAVFLGGKDANLNLPLLRADRAWTPANVHALLQRATGALGRDAPDVFVLANQPFDWRGTSNPFTALPHQMSPSAAYGTALPKDAGTLFKAKLSKQTRKKLRKKEAKLAAVGPLAHRVADSPETRTAILEAFLAQKLARFRMKGIRSEFDTPEMRAFIEAASAPTGGGIELHALFAGERIVATYGGAAHGGQWSGMFNSFDADEEIAKSSPADILLMRIAAKACTDGYGRLDLGIGKARYKATLCDETIPLFDVVLAVSLRGRLFALYVDARQRAKRIVKASPSLLALSNRLRRRRLSA